jgi:hypothetical protein
MLGDVLNTLSSTRTFLTSHTEAKPVACGKLFFSWLVFQWSSEMRKGASHEWHEVKRKGASHQICASRQLLQIWWLSPFDFFFCASACLAGRVVEVRCLVRPAATRLLLGRDADPAETSRLQQAREFVHREVMGHVKDLATIVA